MTGYSESEIASLNKRIENLERRFQRLSDLLVMIGKEVTTDKYKTGCDDTVNAEENGFKSAHTLIAGLVDSNDKLIISQSDEESNLKPTEDMEDLKADKPPLSESEEVEEDIEKFYKVFEEKYSLGYGDFDLYLELASKANHALTNYLDWNHVPAAVQSTLCLEEAHDSKMYYADCKQIQDEFLYFVAPAMPNIKYTQRDFLRLALPYFYDIAYSVNLGDKVLKMIRPAVFFQDDTGKYVLKWKGKIILAK